MTMRGGGAVLNKIIFALIDLQIENGEKMTDYIKLVEQYGSIREAARMEGINYSTFHYRLTKQQAEESLPIVQSSTCYKVQGEDGEVVTTWVRRKAPSAGKLAEKSNITDTLEATIKAYQQKLPRVSATKSDIPDSDLLNAVVLTDCHVNMKSWGAETGVDWDIHIAERVILKAYREALKRLNTGDTLLLINNGDWLHSDSNDPVTPTSKHLLDVDTRFGLAVDTSIRMFRTMIEEGLNSHKNIRVQMNSGNHDLISGLWFRRVLPAIYANEPRVTFETSDSTYVSTQWGNTALFSTHGHRKKLEQLPELLAARFPKLWGQSSYRYAFTGHYHSHKVIERNGVKLIQCPTITAPDAYAHHGGWDSLREIVAFQFSKKHGEVGTVTVRPSMIGEG